MDENEISFVVLTTCYRVHSELGPGLLENVYEEVLSHELKLKGLEIERQKPIPLIWKTLTLETAYKLDILVNKKVIIELKAIESLHPVHFKQVQTYLKLSNLKLGLLINFNVSLLRDGFRRVVNNL